MPNVLDAMRSLVYMVLVVLVLRFARVYGFVLLSAQFGLLLRATIQVHAGGKSGPSRRERRGRSTCPNRDNGRDVSPRDIQARDAQSPAYPQPQPPQQLPSKFPTTSRAPPNVDFQPLSSPPPYSIIPAPKSEPASPSPQAILALYEDIIASDSQTIQVQQETMLSQQETIRAQAQMISMMRGLLERQDERIEELEGVLGCAVGKGLGREGRRGRSCE